MDILTMFPKRDEHAAVIGMTGTGKTTLSRQILIPAKALGIIDPKREFDYGGIKIYTSAEKILREKPARFIYRPHPDDLYNMAAYNLVYKYCYDRGDIRVYTDDAIGVINKTKSPQYLGVCYQMGRSKNVSMVTCFQRPAWMPMYMMSEAKRIFCFQLSIDEDIKRVRSFCRGYSPDMLDNEHAFAYYRAYGMTKAIPVTLHLRGR